MVLQLGDSVYFRLFDEWQYGVLESFTGKAAIILADNGMRFLVPTVEIYLVNQVGQSTTHD